MNDGKILRQKKCICLRQKTFYAKEIFYAKNLLRQKIFFYAKKYLAKNFLRYKFYAIKTFLREKMSSPQIRHKNMLYCGKKIIVGRSNSHS